MCVKCILCVVIMHLSLCVCVCVFEAFSVWNVPEQKFITYPVSTICKYIKNFCHAKCFSKTHFLCFRCILKHVRYEAVEYYAYTVRKVIVERTLWKREVEAVKMTCGGESTRLIQNRPAQRRDNDVAGPSADLINRPPILSIVMRNE